MRDGGAEDTWGGRVVGWRSRGCRDNDTAPAIAARWVRESQQRIAGGMRYAIAAACFPLVVILAVYLRKELSRAASRQVQRRH
jgi:hypothetical protein